MKIYTLYYTDTKLFNKSIFVCPNDETAKKAMKLNLMDKTSPQSERFRDEAKLGTVQLHALAEFTEEEGIIKKDYFNELICNLKDLLYDNNGNMESIESDNT